MSGRHAADRRTGKLGRVGTPTGRFAAVIGGSTAAGSTKTTGADTTGAGSTRAGSTAAGSTVEQEGPSARGVVTTGDGWPLPGASITLLGRDGRQAGRTSTAADGTFTLEGLSPGTGTLLVAAPSHEPSVRPVTVPASGRWDVGTLRLQREGVLSLPAVGRWVIDPAHSTVTARAHHLGLAAVTGRFTGFEGAVTVVEPFERSSTQVTIDASTIDTGTAQRDEHLRSADFLDVVRHPTITYRSTGLTRTRVDGWVLDGELTLLGTPRPVPLDVVYSGSGPDPWGGTRVAFTATTTLDRDEFTMNWNQAVGVGVAVFGTTLRISLEVEAVLEG